MRGSPDPAHPASSPQSPTPSPQPGLLGDFRIVRELGRGGMGVVYEAEQISLGRRVALKVLPFAAMLDKNQLARFKNEARAAATLDHPNIVAIYSVGVERGVHYYAMQLIEGQSLAQAIAAQQDRLAATPSGVRVPAGDCPNSAEGTIAAMVSKQNGTVPLSEAAAPHTPNFALDTAPIAHAPTLPAPTSSLPAFASRDYFRSVAQLGIQAAEALDHAHSSGILHRDVKPANLLVDDAGKLWITDFGLARIEQDTGMTMTGDLLGTLRYMSPEQALAKRIVVDHRSDIYSLGVTLYELATLHPAFPGDDRQELLRQVAFEEPRKPRQINSRIPQDLETIVLKAIEKNPAHRYATATEFANDLQRFVSSQPIKARPATLLQRTTKWSQRNRPVVWASAVALLVCAFAVAGSIGWAVRDQQMRQAAALGSAGSTLNDAMRLTEQSKWPEALAAVGRVDDLLAGMDVDGPLTKRANELRKDVEMVLHLEELPLVGDVATDLRGERYKNAEDNYAQLFRDYGIDVELLAPEAAAAQIRSRLIHLDLASALDSWGTWRRMSPGSIYPDKKGKPLLDLARLVDPDPWRNRIRDALSANTSEERMAAFAAIASAAKQEQLPLRTRLNIAGLLGQYGNSTEAITILKAAQEQHPEDFRVNALLGNVLASSQPPQFDEAIRFHTAACALRPGNAGIHANLGEIFRIAGRLEEAVTHYQRAVELRPDSAMAHNNLGVTLLDLGRLDEAQASLEKAIRLQPDHPAGHNNLGVVFWKKGLLDEAIVSYREALRLYSDYPEAHSNLGNALYDKGLVDEAVIECEECIRLKPDFPNAYSNLASILATAPIDELRDGERAVELATRACELADYKEARFLNTLACAHAEIGDFEAAVKWEQKAMALSDANDAPLFAERLEAFRQQKPWRKNVKITGR